MSQLISIKINVGTCRQLSAFSLNERIKPFKLIKRKRNQIKPNVQFYLVQIEQNSSNHIKISFFETLNATQPQ